MATERASTLKNKFKEHHKKSLKSFLNNHSDVIKAAKNHVISILSGAAFITGVLGTAAMPNVSKNASGPKQLAHNIDDKSGLTKLSSIDSILREDVNTLNTDQKEKTRKVLSQNYGLQLEYELNDIEFPQSWGYFGQEQHLYRWPGDSLSQHKNDLDHGIAPATGAFGYFDNAKQEKYYVAVPLHLMSNWNEDWPTLKPWFRYRKVFVYNPQNQKAVVAVIGDVGPAKWTGKQFGGSPEVMSYLNMYDGSAKSKAVVMFVKNPNEVSLGPVKNKQKVKSLAAKNE